MRSSRSHVLRPRSRFGASRFVWIACAAFFVGWIASEPLGASRIPVPCQAAPDSKLLDCWLEHNPAVAHAISWEVAHLDTEDWFQWKEWRRRDLRAAFRAARKWYAGGMTTWQWTAVADPPPNTELRFDPDSPLTVLDEAKAAWPIYVAHIAFSLAAEIDEWVPWSLVGYSDESLALILTSWGGNAGWNMFKRDSEIDDFYDSISPGYIAINYSTPAHPTKTFKFLKTKALIGDTPAQTIGRVLNWSRSNMRHFLHAGSDLETAECTWQYRGLVPVSRVISGTKRKCGDGLFVGDEFGHWTAGCAGTSGFFMWLFRVVNIPVKMISSDSPGNPTTCGHRTVHFTSIDRYLTHSDDAYNRITQARISPTDRRFYDAGMLLVPAVTWNDWFTGPSASCNNLDRRAAQLALRFPWSDTLIGAYCEDTVAGRSHADGYVYDYFQNWYTVEELESEGLWEDLAEADTSSFSCDPPS